MVRKLAVSGVGGRSRRLGQPQSPSIDGVTFRGGAVTTKSLKITLQQEMSLTEIRETPLPGVGQRVEFVSEDGNRIGVIHHRTGKRELFVCPPEDPDVVGLSLRLSDDESHALADALGGSSVVESLNHMAHQIEGLAIDWLNVDPDTPFVGKTIGDARVRTRTGVSVVAVIRGDAAFPAPGPGFGIEAEDSLVVVGTTEGIEAVRDILTSG